MNDWTRYQLSFAELRLALGRHAWKGIVVGLAMLGLASLAIFQLPREYESQAVIFVRLGHQSLTLDPTVTTNQTVSIYETRETEINSALEVLRSREALNRLIDLVGVDAVLYQRFVPNLDDASPAAVEKARKLLPMSVNQGNEQLREAAARKLEQNLRVWSPKRTNVIGCSARAESPQLAKVLLQGLLIVFREMHEEVNSTSGSWEFFTRQEQRLADEANAAGEKVRQLKTELQVSSLDSKRETLQKQLADLQKELFTSQADLASMTARIAALNSERDRLPKTVSSGRAETANVAADTMRGNLFTLETRLHELLSRYSETHPTVVATREQIQALKNVAGEEPRMLSRDSQGINPIWQQAETSMLHETIAREALQARLTQLQSQRESLQVELQTLNSREIELAAAQRKANVAAEAHQNALQRVEQARLQRELTHDRISNLNVVQAPSLNSRPVSPKRSMLLIAATALSAAWGMVAFIGLTYAEKFGWITSTGFSLPAFPGYGIGSMRRPSPAVGR